MTPWLRSPGDIFRSTEKLNPSCLVCPEARWRIYSSNFGQSGNCLGSPVDLASAHRGSVPAQDGFYNIGGRPPNHMKIYTVCLLPSKRQLRLYPGRPGPCGLLRSGSAGWPRRTLPWSGRQRHQPQALGFCAFGRASRAIHRGASFREPWGPLGMVGATCGSCST